MSQSENKAGQLPPRRARQDAKRPKRQRTPIVAGITLSQGIFLLLLAAALVMGLFWLIESIGPDPRFNKALLRVIGAIATVLTTYFLINRALRLRERESDTIVASFVGYIDYLLQTYSHSYDLDLLDDPAATDMLADLDGATWPEVEAYAKNLDVEVHSLPRFLIDTLCWPSYLRTAEERLLEMQQVTQQIAGLLGVSSPKMAVAVLEVSDQYHDILRQELPVIRRGIRAFRKLEWIAQYCPTIKDLEYHDSMRRDIAASIAAALEGLQYVFQHVPSRLNSEMREVLDVFRQQLPKRHHLTYDEELRTVGESFDID